MDVGRTQVQIFMVSVVAMTVPMVMPVVGATQKPRAHQIDQNPDSTDSYRVTIASGVDNS